MEDETPDKQPALSKLIPRAHQSKNPAFPGQKFANISHHSIQTTNKKKVHQQFALYFPIYLISSLFFLSFFLNSFLIFLFYFFQLIAKKKYIKKYKKEIQYKCIYILLATLKNCLFASTYFSLSVNPKQMFRISVIMLIFKFIFGNLLAIFDWKFWKILDFVGKKILSDFVD